MSAYTQNCVYVFGQKIQGAKENVMSKERLEEIRRDAEKYREKPENEAKKRAAKE